MRCFSSQPSFLKTYTCKPRQGPPCGQYIAKKTFCESNEAASGLSSLRFASCASSERSEGSRSPYEEILRCAQDDRLGYRYSNGLLLLGRRDPSLRSG